MVTLIAALGQNRVIGVKGHLPWRLPKDLQHFKETTVGKTIIMGRLTYESLGRPLPNRQNVVLSSRFGKEVVVDEGVHWCSSIADLVHCCPPDQEWMVIGGGQIYTQMLPFAKRMVLTLVEANIEGDCFFPTYADDGWQKVSTTAYAKDDRHAYAFSVVVFERSQGHSPEPMPKVQR